MSEVKKESSDLLKAAGYSLEDEDMLKYVKNATEILDKLKCKDTLEEKEFIEFLKQSAWKSELSLEHAKTLFNSLVSDTKTVTSVQCILLLCWLGDIDNKQYIPARRIISLLDRMRKNTSLSSLNFLGFSKNAQDLQFFRFSAPGNGQYRNLVYVKKNDVSDSTRLIYSWNASDNTIKIAYEPERAKYPRRGAGVIVDYTSRFVSVLGEFNSQYKDTYEPLGSDRS